MARLYLVRHGQSTWNVAQRTQGQTTHPPLTALGRKQAFTAARLIAADLLGTPMSARRPIELITSDLVRAMETAQIIGQELNCEPAADVRLREQHLGTLEGQTYAQTFHIAEGLDWSDVDRPICGGESVRQVHDRIQSVITDAHFGADDQVVIAVSHGDAIRAAVAAQQGHNLGRAPWVEVPNGSVVQLTAGADLRWLR